MAKPRFSLQEHQNAGKELKEIYGRLVKLNVCIHNGYPKNGEESKAASSATEAVQHLMSTMDDAVCLENPHALNAHVIRCYLGNEPPDPLGDSK